MVSKTGFDPFSTKNLIVLPTLSDHAPVWHGFQIENDARGSLLGLDERQTEPLAILQPQILKLQPDEGVPLPPTNPQAPASLTEPARDPNAGVSTEDSSEAAKDIWAFEDVQIPNQHKQILTWDHFLRPDHAVKSLTCLSEADPRIFDGLLNALVARKSPMRYAKPDVVVRALFNLGLGRDSVFFEWDECTNKFRMTLEDYTLSGLEENTMREVIEEFMKLGEAFRRLNLFTNPRKRSKPLLVSLRSALATVARVTVDHLDSKRQTTHTVIQLRRLFDRPKRLINVLSQLVRVVERQNSQEIIPAVVAFVERAESAGPEYKTVLQLIISRTVQPALRKLDSEVGLSWAIPNNFAEEGLLDTLPASTVELIHWTVNSLRLLHEDEPGHIMLSQYQSLSIRLSFQWDTVAELHKQAFIYENDLKQAILNARALTRTTNSSPARLHAYPSAQLDSADGSDPFVPRFDVFEESGIENRTMSACETGDFVETIRKALIDRDPEIIGQIPCRPAFELSITPCLTVQHRLLSYSVLELLFRKHNLLGNFGMLSRFHLLHDGAFTSRLSLTLFDTAQISGEGNRHTMAKTGLRLPSRDSWPPASSELRLVLMGVLSQSSSKTQDDTLSDTTSFAIRDLSDDELEQCRDVNSIHALDFLRLQYKAPSRLLESVISGPCLEKHDRIFMFLLRLLRLSSLTQGLVRAMCQRGTINVVAEERKLRLAMHHFVSGLASYCQNSAISMHWQIFERKMYHVYQSIEQNDYETTLALTGSVDHVRGHYSIVVDDILSALLLRKKQRPAMALIEEIFSMILRYASVSSLSNTPSSPRTIKEKNEQSIPQSLAAKFAEKVGDLAEHVRGTLRSVGEEEKALLEHLLLHIDYNGYYYSRRTSNQFGVP